jgi:hypothetical protein
MQDPETPPRTRFGLYFFFLAHMTGFGTLTFYVTYHGQMGDAYTIGAIVVATYIPFYLIFFGADDILWLVIGSVFGVLMIYGWLETLAQPFIPEPGTVNKVFITNFDDFPVGRHILPGTFLVMYEFLLRNLLIDLLGARHNLRRSRYASWLFVAISGVQILLAWQIK